MDVALASEWPECPQRRHAPRLAFALFLDNATTAGIRDAHSDGAWVELAHMAECTSFKGDADNELYVAILDRLLGTFLGGLSWSDLQFAFPRGEPERRSHIMRFIAALYKAPDSGLRFWGRLVPGDEEERVMAEQSPAEAELARRRNHFIAFLLEGSSSETLADLADCLAALANGPNCATHAYNFVLASPNRRFTWEFFFSTFAAYVGHF
jgi:hypothetical protein